MCIEVNESSTNKPMTAIPTTATVTATNANEAPRKTHLDYRAATKPGWVFAIVSLVSPAVGLTIYSLKQKSFAYINVLMVLAATLFTVALASPEGEINKGAKVALQLAAGGAAAQVARNNKKNAKKELGIDD